MCYTVYLNICPLVFLKGNQNVTQAPISTFHYMKEYFHITLTVNHHLFLILLIINTMMLQTQLSFIRIKQNLN